jgi:uncharacterized protein YhhL (DUF1145 family)
VPNLAESAPLAAPRRSGKPVPPLGRGLETTLRIAKVVIAGYWLWVLVASVRPQVDVFDSLVAMSAPMLLSLHFVQGMMFLRLLRGRSPWWRDFLMILFFGVVHLWPLLRGMRTRRPS